MAGPGKYAAWKALDVFFEAMMKGLNGAVEGEGKHYFDVIAEGAIFEFKYNFPGWPRKTSSRQELIDLYAGYGKNITLNKVDLTHLTRGENGEVILEYDVFGKTTSGADYNNRFISVAVIKDKQIVIWRDYMDSLAAWTILSGK